MTSRELHIIYPKPTKKMLKLHKGLCKAESTLILWMKTEKMSLKKFLHIKKILGFDSPKCLYKREMQSAKHVLTRCRANTRKRIKMWEENQKKVAFGKISWKMMLTQTKLAKKAAQFMKSFGLIDQFKSVILD